jgi:hypothetical protein
LFAIIRVSRSVSSLGVAVGRHTIAAVSTKRQAFLSGGSFRSSPGQASTVSLNSLSIFSQFAGVDREQALRLFRPT